MRQVRNLVQNMTPAGASLATFANQLADMAQECLEPTELQLQLDLAEAFPDLQLTPEARSHLSLMAREALRNVVQHAGARRVVVGLRVEDHTLSLTVGDDGQGFAASQGLSSNRRHEKGGNGGNGLPNLHARAASLGGKLTIQSRPQQGTTLTFMLPLKRIQAPA